MPWNKLITSGSDAHLNTVSASHFSASNSITGSSIYLTEISHPIITPNIAEHPPQGGIPPNEDGYKIVGISGSGHFGILDPLDVADIAFNGGVKFKYQRYYVSQSNLTTGSISFTGSGSVVVDIFLDNAPPKFHTNMIDTSSMEKFNASSGNGSYYYINFHAGTSAGGTQNEIIFESGQDMNGSTGNKVVQFNDEEVRSYKVWRGDWYSNFTPPDLIEKIFWTPYGNNLDQVI